MISSRLFYDTLQKIVTPAEFSILKKIDDIKIAFNLKTSPRSHHATLVSIQYPLHELPKYCFDFLDKRVATYPVIIDNAEGKTIDFQVLLDWWDEKPENFHNNPFTKKPIQSLEIDTELKELVDRIVSRCVRDAQGYILSDTEMEQALKKIDVYVTDFKNAESCQTRLARKNVDKETISRLTAENLVDEVIDHPVHVDNSHVMDYQELLNWWQDNPEHKYKNPFTEQRIKSISYHLEFKYELEKYDTPEPRPLFSFQLP